MECIELGWLNRNVVSIGVADLMADANYEMVFAVLPLFLTVGLGAPVYAVGLVEGVADGSATLVKVVSGWWSDRLTGRKWLGVAGYGVTAAGFSILLVAAAWPAVLLARATAWMGRGARQPIRSAMLSASVERRDLGKAFGLHEAMDTAGAVVGPAIALLLLANHQAFRTVFAVALIPGIVAVLLFAVLTRDPRGKAAAPARLRIPGEGRFLTLLAAVAVFGAGNFAPAFFTLRAAQLLRTHYSAELSVVFAVAFYLSFNAVGAIASFPAAWLSDRVGRVPVLIGAYLLFGAACIEAILGQGAPGVALMAILAGASNPVVKATEQALTASLTPEPERGTAYGVLDGVNGVGDLVSSAVTGLLWTWRGADWGLAYGALLAVIGASVLAIRLLPPSSRAKPRVRGT
jgi:MFS family permease